MEKFVEKSADILAKMNGEELAGYYNEKNASTTLEIKELKESASKSEEVTAKIEAKLETLDADKLEQMKSLNEAIKQMGLSIKKLSVQEKSDMADEPTLRESLVKNADAIKDIRNSGKWVSFDTKAVGGMTLAGNVSGGNVPVEQRIAGLNSIASRRIRLMDIVSTGVANSNLISWVYQSGKSGAAGQTAEGAVKNQIEFSLEIANQAIKKTTAFIKISDEFKDDVDFINTEINNELSRELLKAIETQLYSGDNTGENLNGVRNTATAFAAGTFAASVDNANIVDVLRIAQNQILIADQDPATFIMMHPSDVTFLKTKKVGSTDERYIDALQVIAGQLLLDGVPIVQTTLVTQDEYLIGNFALATMWTKGALSIEMGLDGSDFTKNMMTIRAEWRGAMVVKNNDRTAFVKGAFAADKAALETA